ncbi:MAG: type II TA system antitoxin MqsA family protein [Paraclostridium sp.]
MKLKQDKVYCEKCNEKVNYNIISENLKEYKGIEVNVEQNIGVCEKCNERLYIIDLEEDNLKRLYSKYRELTGIVSPQDIIDFRAKYNISQRELVAILDWGKMTINRYERGSLPNQSHSEILKLIIKDESYFREKVEDAYKCKRISEKTYNSMHFSMDQEEDLTIDKFILTRLRHNPSIYNGCREFDLDRLENLIGYISSRVNNLYKTSLNKYLWYIDFSNYKHNLRSLTGLRYVRYTFGPIIEGKNYELVLNLDKKFEKEVIENNFNEITKIKSKNNYDLDMFLESEKEVIENIIDLFKNKSVGEISELSHEEKAWLETKDNELISYEYAHELKIV